MLKRNEWLRSLGVKKLELAACYFQTPNRGSTLASKNLIPRRIAAAESVNRLHRHGPKPLGILLVEPASPQGRGHYEASEGRAAKDVAEEM